VPVQEIGGRVAVERGSVAATEGRQGGPVGGGEGISGSRRAVDGGLGQAAPGPGFGFEFRQGLGPKRVGYIEGMAVQAARARDQRPTLEDQRLVGGKGLARRLVGHRLEVGRQMVGFVEGKPEIGHADPGIMLGRLAQEGH